jgi:hypothetical protein
MIHILLWTIGAIALGVAIDWAMFDRVTTITRLTYNQPFYRQTIYPRIFVTILSPVLVLYGSSRASFASCVIAGGVLFFASTAYGIYRTWFGNNQ